MSTDSVSAATPSGRWRPSRRTATIGGAVLVVLVLLSVAIPAVRGGETPWDGELGPFDLPQEARAVAAVDLDETVEVTDQSEVPVRVLGPADWDPESGFGWRPITWASLNVGQFGRWLHGTGAPAELVDAAFGPGPGRPLSTTVPQPGLVDDETGAEAFSGMRTSDEGQLRVLRWDSGTAYDDVALAEDTPTRTDEAYIDALVSLWEETLSAGAVPHRVWAMRLMDTAGSPYTYVELFPAAAKAEVTDGDDLDVEGFTDLPGVTGTVASTADGGLLVVRMEVWVARWVHPDRPSDLPEGWTNDADADPADFTDVVLDGPVRFTPGEPLRADPGSVLDDDRFAAESLDESVGATGLEDLVAVDGDDELREVLDSLPPSLCRDVPIGAIDELLPGNHGPDMEPENFNYPDIPYADHCQWQGPTGFVQIGLLPESPDAPAPVVGDVFAVVGSVGDAVYGLVEQPSGQDVGLTVSWPGAPLRLDGFIHLDDAAGSEEAFGRVGAFLEATLGSVPPDRHNETLGQIIRDYIALTS